MKEGFWKGVRTGLYSYTTTTADKNQPGKSHFDFFRYTHDGPPTDGTVRNQF